MLKQVQPVVSMENFPYLCKKNKMTYIAKDIANKLICRAQKDEANGGDGLTNLKLQKLLYYQQGYHLAAFNSPLFDDDIEAWMYGPVVPSVYNEYSKYGRSTLPIEGNPIQLSDEEEDLFNQVYDTYRDYSAIGLMNLTHNESPWISAIPHDRGTVISKDSMKAFFKNRIE